MGIATRRMISLLGILQTRTYALYKFNKHVLALIVTVYLAALACSSYIMIHSLRSIIGTPHSVIYAKIETPTLNHSSSHSGSITYEQVLPSIPRARILRLLDSFADLWLHALRTDYL